ncbi:MAG: DUF2726 domain-containing protein [Planctomycetaceae bacterium]|nr:DUF2726 domain-containing protein [Planctomycetaceae bacterium]
MKLIGIDLGRASVGKTLPYRLTDKFLSPAELSFYHVLMQTVREEYTVSCKVNLSDIFYVSRPNENLAYRNKIDRKHVDFLLCDTKNMQPLLGIELDDSSHAKKKRQDRDQFVDQVFAVAGLPILHIPAARGYNVSELAELIRVNVQDKKPVVATPRIPGTQHICPKCQIPMVQRIAAKGKQKGQSFWGCTNYPNCRETVWEEGTILG